MGRKLLPQTDFSSIGPGLLTTCHLFLFQKGLPQSTLQSETSLCCAGAKYDSQDGGGKRLAFAHQRSRTDLQRSVPQNGRVHLLVIDFWGHFGGYLKGYFGESHILYVGGVFARRGVSYSVAGRWVLKIIGPNTHPKSRYTKKKHPVYTNFFKKFARTFAFFSVTRVRNPTENFQKNLSR